MAWAYDNNRMQMARRLFATGLAAGCVCMGQLQDPNRIPPGQSPLPPEPNPEKDDRLPNGKSRSVLLAEEEHKRAIDEADQLVKMAQDLRKQLGDAGKFVVPVAAVRKTEEIEKLARKIRSRLEG
jgi:hypothetical protein